MQTYSDGKRIYSVDMMFAYVNIFKPKYLKIKIDKMIHNLGFKCWGDPIKKIEFSPLDVMRKPTKYKLHMERIRMADLKYPIIAHIKNGQLLIIDGVHRLAKAKMENKKTMNVYIFDHVLLRKFLINSKGDWNKVDKTKSHKYIELFHKRFCK